MPLEADTTWKMEKDYFPKHGFLARRRRGDQILLCLPTFSHFVIVNKTSLSLSLDNVEVAVDRNCLNDDDVLNFYSPSLVYLETDCSFQGLMRFLNDLGDQKGRRENKG
jgi:hypothetical protein